MSYATIDDVLSRYRPIASMVGSGAYDVSSSEVSSVYITQSEAYIDARLSQRYAVPFTISNPLITQIAADLSIFSIMAEKMPSVPEFMDRRRQRAEDLLTMLADGTLAIASATVTGSSGDSFAWSSNMGYTPVFSPVLDPLDQRADIDRKNAELLARGGAPWASDRC